MKIIKSLFIDYYSNIYIYNKIIIDSKVKTKEKYFYPFLKNL
jgi:hypothetical protein